MFLISYIRDYINILVYFSLRNIDNTCYVNATLQALFSLPGFTDDLVMACQGVENLPQFSSLLVNMVDARKKGLPIEVDKFNE